MNCILLMSVVLCHTQGINVTPYMELLPLNCSVRIDIVNDSNRRYYGWAWYSKRITIYDKTMVNKELKQYVLAHELGHACGKGSRRGSYNDREVYADNYAREYLKNRIKVSI